MTYQETIQYLYNSAPLFQEVGGAAYKPGLQVTETLDSYFGHPHQQFQTIHIAGSNGKGSCAHTLATWLQLSGLRVGLYTSPHLIDFRERIRVNGEMIPQDFVIDFVEKHKHFFEPLHPSFFELTTALAFHYFHEAQVDVAIVEVGLGGRLDCTNIITPILSIITNISLDHTQFLGHTLQAIAKEKAGIIKPSIPVCIGEALPETRQIFQNKADEVAAPIMFAEDTPEIITSELLDNGMREYDTVSWGKFSAMLTGNYQIPNTNTILHAMQLLLPMFPEYTDRLTVNVGNAFRQVCRCTGLHGRWEKISDHPDIICDAGHNPGGWKYLGEQLVRAGKEYEHLHIVFGMAEDKDIDTVLTYLPHDARYYYTRASVKRAMNEDTLYASALQHGLYGETYPDVRSAISAARQAAGEKDLIFIGGSCFVIADALPFVTEVAE